MNQAPLSLVPASRSTDGMGSVDAEEALKDSGKLAEQQLVCLKAFCKHPGATTKEAAQLEGLDRYMIGRRASQLEPVYLTRLDPPDDAPKGHRQFRWRPTEVGRRVGERS